MTIPVRTLLVEDDEKLAALLREYLAGHGFDVGIETRGDAAVDVILRDQPTLVMLDLMLPGLNGLEVCRRIRPGHKGGILMLTASKSEADQVVGLEIGADDYVTKPIEPRLLVARLRSLLRRVTSGAPSSDALSVTINGLTINRHAREARVGGTLVPLTGVELDILWALASLAGEVVTRDDLYALIRGTSYNGLERGIDVHVSRIRRKLMAVGFDAEAVKAVRGAGYLLARR